MFSRCSDAKYNYQVQKPIITVPKRVASNQCQDWGEAVDVSVFYGRIQKLAILKQWIVGDRCRLITILGMSGIGKTLWLSS